MIAAPAATWSVNHRAALAVAVHAGGTAAERHELLEILGLVDGPHGRELLPDDTRPIEVATIMVSPAAEETAVRAAPSPARASSAPAGLRLLPAVEKQRPRSAKSPARCGTLAGYSAHRNRGEQACEACREARSKYDSARRGTRKNAKVARCGTRSGWAAHQRSGTPICQPCREANTAYQNARDERLRRERGIGPRQPAQCGTRSGYAAHRRREEAACQPCKDAHAQAHSQYMAQRRQAAR